MMNSHMISNKIRNLVSIVCIMLVVLIFIVDFNKWIGIGMQKSIPTIITLLSLLIVWSWKDELKIFKIGPGGIESATPATVKDVTSSTDESKNTNDNDNELPSIRINVENAHNSIKNFILQKYKNIVGAIDVDIIQRDFNIPSVYTKIVLDSLCDNNEAYSTLLPNNTEKKYYILKSNLINQKIEKAIDKLKHTESVLNIYKFFNLNQTSIDAMVLTDSTIYVVNVYKSGGLIAFLNDSEQKRILIESHLSTKPNKPVKICLVIDTNEHENLKVETNMTNRIVLYV